MRKFRNTIFFLVLVYIFILTTTYTRGIQFSVNFYFFSLTIIISLFIVIEVIYTFNVTEDIRRMVREKEKMMLSILDSKQESIFLSTLVDVIETFNPEITLDEILNMICQSIYNVFPNETILLQLLGSDFKRSLKGKKIEFSEKTFQRVIDKAYPVLINNTSSFPQYKELAKQGVTSFLLSPFHRKRNIEGFIGIFSFDGRQFSIKELDLLRQVSAPTSLLIENTMLFNITKTLSITDSLTKLHNRRYFEQKLEEIVSESGKEGKVVSLCIADVDFFKFYNDLNGHQAGDVVLEKIAEILKEGVKGSDVIGRYGGEEFIIIFPDTDKNLVVKICDTIRRRIKDYEFYNEKRQPNNDLTVSFGVAMFPDDATTPEQLIRQADFALYRAKEEGRDRVISQ